MRGVIFLIIIHAQSLFSEDFISLRKLYYSYYQIIEPHSLEKSDTPQFRFHPIEAGIETIYGSSLYDKKFVRTAFFSLESLLVSGLFTKFLKNMPVSRSLANSEIRNSTSAFSVATVISSEYQMLAPFAYGLSTLRSYEKSESTKGLVSDLFLSSLIGYVTAQTLISLHNPINKRIYTFPFFINNGLGIKVIYPIF